MNLRQQLELRKSRSEVMVFSTRKQGARGLHNALFLFIHFDLDVVFVCCYFSLQIDKKAPEAKPSASRSACMDFLELILCQKETHLHTWQNKKLNSWIRFCVIRSFYFLMKSINPPIPVVRRQRLEHNLFISWFFSSILHASQLVRISSRMPQGSWHFWLVDNRKLNRLKLEDRKTWLHSSQKLFSCRLRTNHTAVLQPGERLEQNLPWQGSTPANPIQTYTFRLQTRSVCAAEQNKWQSITSCHRQCSDGWGTARQYRAGGSRNKTIQRKRWHDSFGPLRFRRAAWTQSKANFHRRNAPDDILSQKARNRLSSNCPCQLQQPVPSCRKKKTNFDKDYENHPQKCQCFHWTCRPTPTSVSTKGSRASHFPLGKTPMKKAFSGAQLLATRLTLLCLSRLPKLACKTSATSVEGIHVSITPRRFLHFAIDVWIFPNPLQIFSPSLLYVVLY